MTRPGLCIHGHFYQPPRENPWSGRVDRQPSAAPAHDWNERITADCYRPNVEARILADDGLPERVFDNYSRISFDFGPTLLAYLEREQRDVYEAVRAADRASRRRFEGHGAALAQSYSHCILPLANDRDRRTEVRWGLRDFELRFGRHAEGLWLPEAAVDLPTLEVLAAEGVSFTLLAPHQAARVRTIEDGSRGSRKWTEIGAAGGATLDTHVPYRLTLPSGRSLAVFFYDGSLAHAVAFGEALRDGAAFLSMLEKAAVDGPSCLVHLATDGESYGHHHAFAEMALAWALDRIERGRSALSLTVYGRQLAAFPPTMEVQIHEKTSWSCAHGIERWRSNCGCNGGRHRGADQNWRGPLRSALDLVRDGLARAFENEAAQLLRDPWDARDHFVELLTHRAPARERAFLTRHAARELGHEEGRRALQLLEMQRHALLMYASCAWFFDDLADIEPRQALAHAAYAIELAGDAIGERLAADFAAALGRARSITGVRGDALLGSVVRERKNAARAAQQATRAQAAGADAARHSHGISPVGAPVAIASRTGAPATAGAARRTGKESKVDDGIAIQADALRTRLGALGANLWWSWDRRLEGILRRIDAELWEEVEHNPTAFALDVDSRRLVAAAPALVGDLAELEERLAAYLNSTTTWAARRCRGLTASTVAYFSPEFCIHGSLPIYSGGLGVLAGDHLKSCSDLGVNAYGVSLLYRHGYFRQQIEASGWQIESYEPLDPERLPLAPACGPDGVPLRLTVRSGSDTLSIGVWLARIGRANLLLLDPHEWPQRVLPGALRLYGGDYATRLVQEVVLGAGGYRALRALGLRPSVLHMNEGHSAFAALEAIADRMEETGLGFEQAAADVATSVVFTTHTPVEAGHDRFPPAALLDELEPLRARLGLDPGQLLALGRVHPEDGGEPFCMTVCALKLARHSNAVSSLHGHVSRRMWKKLWPQRRELDVPIGHVTNGVHAATWLVPELGALYGASFARDWSDPAEAERSEAELAEVDAAALWRAKQALKRRLLAFVRELAAARNRRLLIDDPLPELNPDALTIVVARRFALYKRALLPFRDLERAKALLSDERRPVQILLAGKAHPADEPAKNVIRAIFDLGHEERLQSRVVFVEGYDQHVSRALLAGADLWLNIPRRPQEACGTSGMKAVLNATLNCSTLDGWWDEAFEPRVGFAVGDGGVHADAAVQDDRDAAAVIDVLEREVVPLYYRRDEEGVPRQWMERVKRALATLAYRYSADRMVVDYATRLYAPAAGRVSIDVRD